jgi:hypothetical protein
MPEPLPPEWAPNDRVQLTALGVLAQSSRDRDAPERARTEEGPELAREA